MKMLRAIEDRLANGSDLVYVTLLSKSGSAPSSAEAQMLVDADGGSVGTVGGGRVEAEAQRRSAAIFRTRRSEELAIDLTGTDAGGTDMICGGRVRLLLDYIEPTPENYTVFHTLRTALQEAARCYLVTAFTPQTSSVHGMLPETGSVVGPIAYPAAQLATLAAQAHDSVYPIATDLDGASVIVERGFIPSTVYILGAGHVGQQVARVAGIAGFVTVVLDDRPEYANRERFPDADVVHVLKSFDDCFPDFAVDPDSFIVIVTRGHAHDKAALSQALRTDAGYVGMIGSRTKRDKIYRALGAQGYSGQELASVHCPIGLDIGGESPGEIAVSIVAELVQVRARAHS